MFPRRVWSIPRHPLPDIRWYAYSHWLFKVPMAATINFTTKNRNLLHECDFLSKDENRVLFELTEPPFESEDTEGGQRAVLSVNV